jgi:hypothetical protein
MKSASCYTNKVRVLAEAKNTKVQYPGDVARNWFYLYPAGPCNPNFQVIQYTGRPCFCLRHLVNRNS